MIVKWLGILDIFIAVCFWIFGVFHLNIMAGFILVLGFFLLVNTWILVYGLIYKPQESLAGLLITLTGLGVYFLSRKGHTSHE